MDYDDGTPGRPLALTIGAVDLRDLPALLSRVRRLFDLDADPVAIDSALGGDGRLAAAVAGAPGHPDAWCDGPAEMLVRAMIGQQITVAAARTALTQLAAVGRPEHKRPATGSTECSPPRRRSPRRAGTCCAGPAQNRITRGNCARTCQRGLELGYGDDLPGLRAKLLPVAGVGPWTVGYVAMR